MKRTATFVLAVVMLSASSGCYCWAPYGGYGYGGACPGGNCGYVAPGAVAPGGAYPSGGTYPAGSYYSPYGAGTMQSAVPYAAPATAGVPVYSNTAVAPLESLPTYY